MTVSAKVRKSLPASRLGDPKSDGYPMQDKKHAAIAKGFAAMHNAPNKAEIDAKANRILAAKRGGFIMGKGKKPSFGRPGRAYGGTSAQETVDRAQRMDPALRDQATKQFNEMLQPQGGDWDPGDIGAPHVRSSRPAPAAGYKRGGKTK
jgi:hypothetical protein